MNYAPIAQSLRIDEISTRFEEALKRNHSPRMEAYLEEAPPDVRPALLEELLALELWYARTRESELFLSDYLKRFPQHPEIVRGCFEEDAKPPVPPWVISTVNSSGLESRGPGADRQRAPDSSIVLPEEFGRYRILRQLGEGGMGSVYLAQDRELGRCVALKVPRLTRSNQPALLSRFRREAQAAARIVHPNLCPVYDIGEIDGVFYLTMAYIEGQPLSEHLTQRRPPNVHHTISLIRKIAQALAAAHDLGVIHRDLKPANIMINPRGEPVVVDFGLARTQVGGETRLTQTGAMLGTPAYASPEQIEGDKAADTRTDIYSLGMIFYELLTGQLPFDDSTPLALLNQIIAKEPAPPSTIRPQIPRELDSICLKAIAKLVEARYQTMQEFEAAIAAWEAQTSLVENSRPTVVTTPSQLEDASPKGSANSKAASSVSSPKFPCWTAKVAPRARSVAMFFRNYKPSTDQWLWAATLGGLLICGFLVASHWLRPAPVPGTEGKLTLAGNIVEFGHGDGGDPPPPPQPPPPPPEPVVLSPDFRAEFPEPGGWTELTGRLWRYGLTKEQTITFDIKLRSVSSQTIDRPRIPGCRNRGDHERP